MLEDVGQARTVAGRRAKRDAKDLVVIIWFDDGEDLGLGLLVLVEVAGRAVFIERLRL